MQPSYPHHHAQAIALLAVPAPTTLRTFDAAPLTPEAMGVAAIVHLQVSRMLAAAARCAVPAYAAGTTPTRWPR